MERDKKRQKESKRQRDRQAVRDGGEREREKLPACPAGRRIYLLCSEREKEVAFISSHGSLSNTACNELHSHERSGSM